MEAIQTGTTDRRRPLGAKGPIFCAVLAALLVPAAAAGQAGGEGGALAAFSKASEDLARRVAPSVVQVVVASHSYGLGGPGGSAISDLTEREHGYGAGVIVGADGYVLTNAHVIEGAQRVQVVLNRTAAEGPAIRDAEIVGTDAGLDLALLKVVASGLPALSFADAGNLRQGQMVFAFGSPEGFENSVTLGVVSAVDRQVETSSRQVFIQTDAPINPGSSGGPLVDAEGRIVGINTFIYTESGGSEGLGFAIPSFTARFAFDQLRRFGRVHRYGAGMDVQSLTPVLARGLGLSVVAGLVVADVWPGGGAEKNGIREGDLLVGLDGQPLRTMGQYLAFFQQDRKGQKVRIELMRGDVRRTVETEVVERAEEKDALADLAAPSGRVPLLGIAAVSLEPRLRQGLPDLRSSKGVLVVSRIVGAPEGSSELEQGDVVRALNGRDVDTLDALRRGLASLKAGDPVVLLVEREGATFFLAFAMD